MSHKYVHINHTYNQVPTYTPSTHTLMIWVFKYDFKVQSPNIIKIEIILYKLRNLVYQRVVQTWWIHMGKPIIVLLSIWRKLWLLNGFETKSTSARENENYWENQSVNQKHECMRISESRK